jgi:squalene-hopene/tetraprenyl-beta-curcumene cyclase
LIADLLPRLESSLAIARQELLAARDASGHWVGELSPSALSTATAVAALAIVQRELQTPSPKSQAADEVANAISPEVMDRGLDWLANNINGDGGWGDTPTSLSNVSTTALCWGAFGAVPGADEKHIDVIRRIEHWFAWNLKFFNVPRIVNAIVARYGKDRTFSVPILTMLALSGRLGEGAEAWERVMPLPFELAALPHSWFAALRLPVVSYALPALIAIGQARHHHLPPRGGIRRRLRDASRERTLAKLAQLQPENGGFLEATPLTSFVVMSLAGSGRAHHPVVRKGVEFLLKSQRRDGSWPIDTNLATWLTTLAVNALAGGPESLDAQGLSASDQSAIRSWLLRQQFRAVHPYTRAAPGGWAWTDLPGGVPDADDTAGALVALKNLAPVASTRESRPRPAVSEPEIQEAATLGVRWLLDLQNRDGGIPTFCRGWGNLPFDRSAPDLTGHALQAWALWLDELPEALQSRVRKAIGKAVYYLAYEQRKDGAWVPLWFGNEMSPTEENPTYGTSRVLVALRPLADRKLATVVRMQAKALTWLLRAQRADGSWGGDLDCHSSTEETALAMEALAASLGSPHLEKLLPRQRLEAALYNAAFWLCDQIETGCWMGPAPIGFYFAKLWYFERLYPQIFTVAALERTVKAVKGG